jgi:hypothetical protein
MSNIIAIETLYHFSCHCCNGWWSVSDWKPAKIIYCPHCGTCADVVSIEVTEQEIA